MYDFILTHLNKERNAEFFGPELIGMLQRFLEIDLYRSSLDATSYTGDLKVIYIYS